MLARFQSSRDPIATRPTARAPPLHSCRRAPPKAPSRPSETFGSVCYDTTRFIVIPFTHLNAACLFFPRGKNAAGVVHGYRRIYDHVGVIFIEKGIADKVRSLRVRARQLTPALASKP